MYQLFFATCKAICDQMASSIRPENFLFTSKDEDSQLKAIDFGLSDFVKPDEKLNDIVESAYYVAPEVLIIQYRGRCVEYRFIAYILLCGSRPSSARTGSGIFRAVLKADPSFDELPLPSLSSEAKDFVRRMANKDPRKRITAAQVILGLGVISQCESSP